MTQELLGSPPAGTLTGTVERIVYRHPGSGWTLARVVCEGAPEAVPVVGGLADLAPGTRVRLEGRWTTHAVHGPRFEVQRHETQAPDTPEALTRFLSSGLFKGVGPRLAARIVSQFGLETLAVLARTPERLTEVPGLGASRRAALLEAWQAQRGVQALTAFLQTHGVPAGQAARLHEAYGEAAIEVVKNDPFRLLDDLSGLPFAVADRLATRLGLPADAPQRLTAGLRDVLREAGAEGHMALPRGGLLRRARARSLPGGALDAALAGALAAGTLHEEAGLPGEEPLIWAPGARRMEVALAEGLGRLLRRAPEVMPGLAERLARVEEAEHLTLSTQQREAVLAAAASRLFVLTGGPGTGKTTTLRTLVRLFEDLELVVRLASPTGRAARRLEEVTGRKAVTLHRLLGYQAGAGTFARGRGWPVEADVVLVDEASMLDAAAALALVEALPALAQLVLVGDADQLPPVGPGQVLADLVASPRVPTRCLTTVFRQAGQSAIVRSAHRIRRGELPELTVPTGAVRTDCYFLAAETPEEALALIENVVTRSLPARFGLDAVRDIQVITPTNRGPLGAAALNERLRPRLLSRPEQPSRPLQVGDKVIQLENDAARGVYNGEMGIVVEVEPATGAVRVQMGDLLVAYDAPGAEALGLGWAITVHKSQGSEFPAVVLPLALSHGPLLQRKLLYTALTRARRVVVLVGQQAAIARAVACDEAARRVTRLTARLEALPE
ncbi:MAG: ATP-dependent RecD-like DNA helicase [Candidatus Sericytochromatia bacterium]|nr:ATP-dependent RecD-like DNA helicase [Candidatus Sericytochromatia bacterium]